MNGNYNDKDPWRGPYDPGPQPYYSVRTGNGRKKKRFRAFFVLFVIAAMVCATAYYTLFNRSDKSAPQSGLSFKNLLPGGVAAQSSAPAPAQSPVPSGTGGGSVSLTIVDIPATPEPSMVVDASGRAPLTVAQIAKKVIPSVVGVVSESSSAYYSGGIGSGIIMDAAGYIITNYHVIEGADKITVVLDSGESFRASLTGLDEQSDLAVLKIEADHLQPAEFGNSEALEAGDLAVAIGNPMGLELQSTVTCGVISAINRDIAVNDRSMTMLQTDASINPGNSGGPLINQYGQVIGINTVKYVGTYSTYSEGLGFAIPINTAKPIIDELIRHGYVKGRPAIGISGLAVTGRMMAFYGYPAGVLITDISSSSDAYAKGLRTGDIIVGVNGKKVSDMDEINSIKNKFSAGDTITLTIYRGGRTADIDIVLADSAEMAGANTP